ncbi:MAG: helix-hairpin-helix domain-containing protein [Chitinophagaceae bacterium]
MNWKKVVADYFTFTRGNRIAILAILFVTIGVFFLPDVLSKTPNSKTVVNDTTWIAAMKRIEQKENNNISNSSSYNENNSSNYQYDRNSNKSYTKSKGELFYFDPNTLSAAGWKKLGLRDKTISTILNYLSKGGKFRKPEDLSRIYGLFPNEFERIVPYIAIVSTGTPDYVTENKVNKQNDNPSPKTYTSRYSIIDINTADTTALITLPGIGSKLSARIISFRDKLGGFYSINQVGETFALPDSTFQKIKQYLKLETTSLRKININTATIDELKAHPYIRYTLANPIVAYRNQHGNFVAIEDIKKIMVITEDIFTKIAPYLSVQ